jgi:NSS family neurotransmitter:Na+ symporter
MSNQSRSAWGSRLGFILAASGSAIGLGNIVFFSARAYEYGGGAFYLPYLIALAVVGLPVLIVELGLGRARGGAFPHALGSIVGRAGEFQGWWAIMNALTITMYYITLLGWVAGMGWRAFTGTLFEPSVPVDGFGMELGEMPNPTASFFDMISDWGVLVAVVLVWLVNILLVSTGTRGIERAVRWLMPMLWVCMGGLAVVGFTLPAGTDGMWLLLTPQFGALASPVVWNGAFAQIFFTLSLGFGVMTAYASYLPRRSDDVANAAAVAGLNCLFELVAGLAVFSLLASFALPPRASTLAMMFFIVPAGIGQLPVAISLIGTLFFTLLLVAGLTSSVSLLEAAISALLDKFGGSRRRAVAVVCSIGIAGSMLFALPVVIDAQLAQAGTLGLTLLDFIDHYANGYGLILVGVGECVIVGWFMPRGALRQVINEHSRLKLGPWFDVLIRWVIPGVLLVSAGSAMREELVRGTVYGTSDALVGVWGWLPVACLLIWLAGTLGAAGLLTIMPPGRTQSGTNTGGHA